MTAQIPINADLAFRLLDEVSRVRALCDEESILLEQLVCRGHRSAGVRVQWNVKLDRALLRASYRNGSIKKFAAEHGIPDMACYKRLEKLRKRQADKEARLCGLANKS